tara:strand:- start:19888 stop:21723 length:1836 start_codon:yes stop_codon:yes gene_type:complete
MNILEQEDQLKGMPDSMLLMEMDQPSGMYPPFLVASEQQRRNSMRENYAASEQQPTTTVVEQEFQKGLASMMPPSSPAPVAPNSLPPPIPVGGLSQGSMGAGDPVMANTGGQFPDLSGDGKITKKDILMGRGVVTMDTGSQVPAYATGAIESQQQAARDLDAGLAALARQGVSAAEATARYSRDAIMSLGRSIAAAEGSTRMFYPEYRDKDVPYSNPNSVAVDQAGILGEVLEGAGGLLLDTLPEAQEFPDYEQQFRDFSGPPMTAEQRESSEAYQEGLARSQPMTPEEIAQARVMAGLSSGLRKEGASDLPSDLEAPALPEVDQSILSGMTAGLLPDSVLEEIQPKFTGNRELLDAQLLALDADETPQDDSFTPTDEQLLVFEDIVRRGSDDDDAPFRMQGMVDNQNIPETRAVNTDLSRIIDEGQDLTKSRVEEIQDLIDRSRSDARSDAFYAAIGRIGAGIAKGDLGAGIDAGIGEMTGRQREQRRNELALQAQKMAAQDKDIDRRAKIIADIAGLDLSERRLQAIIDQNEDLNSRNDVARLNAVQRVVSDIFDPDEYVDEAARRRGYTMIFNAFASQYSVPTIPVPQGSASSGDTVQQPPLDNFYGQ